MLSYGIPVEVGFLELGRDRKLEPSSFLSRPAKRPWLAWLTHAWAREHMSPRAILRANYQPRADAATL